VVVEACTGSGKTLSYLIPVYQLILNRFKTNEDEIKETDLLGIIICPTRELTLQVYQLCQIFSKKTGVKSQILTGGVSNENFIGNIAVCTPGNFYFLFLKVVYLKY
jgi:superfamily II DNA/RNA helicase